jgi:Spy/CpxP family protein refolding chaperone
MSSARGEPKSLLKGIKLTDAEKKATGDIEKRYADQFKDLEKADKASDKAGTPDAALIARIDALRLQERADLRAALTPEQQLQFDKNIAALGTKKS